MKTKLLGLLLLSANAHAKRPLSLVGLFERSIHQIGTCSLVLGVCVAALGFGRAAAYLLALGVLIHLAGWFGDWWEGK